MNVAILNSKFLILSLGWFFNANALKNLQQLKTQNLKPRI